MNRLNCIAHDKGICNASGQVWRFQAHQFRCTAIARMINDGVPLHIIQYYLNAQTLDEVVGVYKQLFGQPRKEESISLITQIVGEKGNCVGEECISIQ